MTTDLIHADATELAELIRTGKASSVEVVQAHLDRIEAVNPRHQRHRHARRRCARRPRGAADEQIASGAEVGPLHGVPFTVKDSFDTAGVLTQRGSPIFAGRVPDTDATTVARMKRAGGILLAKTNLPEFSYWIESDNLLTGRTNNPWDLDRSSGGSSGGESAAIAAGMSPLGLGERPVHLGARPGGRHRYRGAQGDARAHPDDGDLAAGAAPRLARRPDGPHHPRPRAGVLAAGRPGRRRRLLPRSRPSSTPAWAPRRTGPSASAGWSTRDSARSTREVAATVQAAADALQAAGVRVEAVSIPALERDNPLELFMRQHVMEVKPAFREATAGHEDQMFTYSKTLLATPDTSVEDYVAGRAGHRTAPGRLRGVLPARTTRCCSR